MSHEFLLTAAMFDWSCRSFMITLKKLHGFTPGNFYFLIIPMKFHFIEACDSLNLFMLSHHFDFKLYGCHIFSALLAFRI